MTDNFKLLEDLLKPFLSEDARDKGIEIKRILDIGCGDGYFVKRLRKKGFEAYGIDLRPRTRCRHVRKGDARSLKEYFKDMRFDAIVVKGILCTGGQLASWLYKDKRAAKKSSPNEILREAYPNSFAILKSCYSQLNSFGVLVDYEPDEKHSVKGVPAEYKIFHDKKAYTKRDAEDVGFKVCTFNKYFSVLIKKDRKG